MKDTVLPKK